jgi:hypothetical protein
MGHLRTKSRFGTPQRPVPTPVAYGLGRRDALQFSLQSSSNRHFRLFFLILPSRLQKPLGGGPKPKTARLAVGKSQGCLHLPDRHSPGEKFGRLLENRKIGREGILSNGRSLSVRQICTKSIHRPSRRAQAPTAPQRERAAIGPSIARQDHVLDDRIDLGLPALAGEHAVVAYTGLHVVALKIGS